MAILLVSVGLFWFNTKLQFSISRSQSKFFYFLGAKFQILGLQVLGKLPFRLRSFLSFALDSLIVDYESFSAKQRPNPVSSSIKFRHRKIQDYFLYLYLISIAEKGGLDLEARHQLAKELQKVKNAGLDVLMELVEDEIRI